MRKITEFLRDLVFTLYNDKRGQSARKWSVLAVTISTLFLSFKFADKTNIVEIMVTNWTYCAILLGIVTAEQIINFKNGKITATEVTLENKAGKTTVSEITKEPNE